MRRGGKGFSQLRITVTGRAMERTAEQDAEKPAGQVARGDAPNAVRARPREGLSRPLGAARRPDGAPRPGFVVAPDEVLTGRPEGDRGASARRAEPADLPPRRGPLRLYLRAPCRTPRRQPGLSLGARTRGRSGGASAVSTGSRSPARSPRASRRPSPASRSGRRTPTAGRSPTRRRSGRRAAPASSTTAPPPRRPTPPVRPCSSSRASSTAPTSSTSSPVARCLRWLAGQGLRPLLLDWGTPGPAEASFDLAAYGTERLVPALLEARRLAGGPVPVMGYCMGGTLAVGLAARRPDDVSALLTIGAPWDFTSTSGMAGGCRAAIRAEGGAGGGPPARRPRRGLRPRARRASSRRSSPSSIRCRPR